MTQKSDKVLTPAEVADRKKLDNIFKASRESAMRLPPEMQALGEEAMRQAREQNMIDTPAPEPEIEPDNVRHLFDSDHDPEYAPPPEAKSVRDVYQMGRDSGSRGETTNLNFSREKFDVQPDQPDQRYVNKLAGFNPTVLPPYRQPPALTPKVKDQAREWQEIELLPSDFGPYQDKVLYMSPFSLNDLFKAARWAHTGSPEHIMSALDATVWPQHALELTIADAMVILYMHRSLSYPRSPHTMEWQCADVDAGGMHYPGCGHVNLTELKTENIYITRLSDAVLGFSYAEMHKDFDLPRMSIYEDYVHLEEQSALWSDYSARFAEYEIGKQAWLRGLIDVEPTPPKQPKMTINPEELFIWRAALWYKHGYSLREKYDNLMKKGNSELLLTGLGYDRTLGRYGVKEETKVRCSKCGAERKFVLRLSPAAFVP